MRALSLVAEPVGPWVLKSTVSIELASEHAGVLLRAVERARVLILDGGAMETLGNFYDEIVRGLRLPAYFGRNLNALDECVCDLEWLNGTGFLLLVEKAEKILRLESADPFDGFLDVLNRAGRAWSQPIEVGEIWDRPPRPFHTVFLRDSIDWRRDIPLFQFDMKPD